VKLKPKLSVAHLVAIGILLSFQVGLFFVQDVLFDGVFPNTPTTFGSQETQFFAARRQRTKEFFALDTRGGPYGVLQQFGRPPRARIFKIPEYNAPPYPDRTRLVEYRVYSYPGMEITFRDDGQLILIEITDAQWTFPVGVKVGDPERSVYDRFGPPRWRYEYDGQRQLDWSFTARLSIYVRDGKVSRIVWG
jgi:hypothetical protein